MSSVEPLPVRVERAIAWIRSEGLRALRPALTLSALAAIGAYLALAAVHLRYPFELEWMEGGMVDHIRRVVAGQPVYVKPSIDFSPYIYPPLYYYVAGAAAKALGVGFFSARLVSVASSLGVFAIIARFVQRETGSRFHAVVAVGFYAGTYHAAAGFYDLARADSLFVLLLLGGLYLVRFHPSRRARVAASALFWLAFLTKQTAPLVFAPVALHLAIAERRRSLWFIAPALAAMIASVVVLDRMNDGWFTYFVWWVPRHHPVVRKLLWEYWTKDLMSTLAVSCLFSLYYFLVETKAEGRRFYLLALVGALGVGWSGRLHHSGWYNVNMPVYAMLAILFGLALHAAAARAAAHDAGRPRGGEAFVLGAALLQFACLAYDPRQYVPTAADRAAGEHLLATIRGIPGDVFVPAHGYLTALAGKRTFTHEVAFRDLASAEGGGPGGRGPGARARARRLRAAVRRGAARHGLGAGALRQVLRQGQGQEALRLARRVLSGDRAAGAAEGALSAEVRRSPSRPATEGSCSCATTSSRSVPARRCSSSRPSARGSSRRTWGRPTSSG